MCHSSMPSALREEFFESTRLGRVMAMGGVGAPGSSVVPRVQVWDITPGSADGA